MILLKILVTAVTASYTNQTKTELVTPSVTSSYEQLQRGVKVKFEMTDSQRNGSPAPCCLYNKSLTGHDITCCLSTIQWRTNLMADVSGTWLGTYWQQGIPTRFEVTLIQSGNTLTGRTLDDSDLGEAQLTGEVIGRRISFIKRYFTTSPEPITYVGTISENEDYMQGQWSIKLWNSGPWEARRSGDALIADLQTRIDKKVSLTGS